MSAGLADQMGSLTDEQAAITRAAVMKWFVIIVAVGFILRILYAGHLYEDDGLWFTAAEEIARGKALYREVYFDKPPGLPLIYAALFRIFGAHIITIRLFTIAYSAAISVVLYLFGARLYGKRIGLIAGTMFAVFSTTYVTGHVQSLNTELLMALPYAAGAYLMVRAIRERAGQAWLALTGGALAGLAFQVNPKGIFDLIFFAVMLIASRRWMVESARREAPGAGKREGQPGWLLFAAALAGLALMSLPFLAYLAATRSLKEYWLYFWDWGARYGSYYGASKIILTALTRSADYFLQNNTLLIGFVFLVAMTLRSSRRGFEASRESIADRLRFQSDVTLLMWLVVSYVGVMTGGRFFGHYFIQILPALCLIGARGLGAMLAKLRTRSTAFRRLAIAAIAIGFAFTMVRFHTRGILLAADFMRGVVSETNSDWYYNVRGSEERIVAAAVRDLPEDANSIDGLGLEAIRAGGPRTRPAEGPADYLFVWGYRPEIYFWSGLLPASRFLSTQPLTGVPADVHYFGDDYRSLLGEAATSEARAQLARDLEETQPKYIVDEIGFFNADLAILRYPELRDVMNKYKPLGPNERFLIYVRNELRRKYQLRHAESQQ